MRLLIADAEVDGRRVDVRIAGGRISEVGAGLSPVGGEERYDAHGGALLPGLHDHHLHLFAMAAAASSVECGPPSVVDLDGLAERLRTAARGSGTIRGTGYHESVAGLPDRFELDRLVADRPVRIQHRGGALWLLNTAALRAVGLLGGGPVPPGVELGADREPTGRLWRADRELQVDGELPDLTAVGARLLRFGITGVTDATPDLSVAAVRHLADARRCGSLPQQVCCLGAPDVDPAACDGEPLLTVGPRKLLLADHDLPSLDRLVGQITASHASDRPVAVHCVTRTSLVLTVAALDAAGRLDGDRIEHAAVVPADLRPRLRALGVRVVTQPSFIRERGESYLASVEADDLDCLYPFASLLAAGVPVTASSDAPFGDVDPWAAIDAAASRTTAAGTVIGAAERVSPQTALAGYLTPATDPGGNRRRVAPGAPAELCLLGVPLREALRQPRSGHIALVVTPAVRYDAAAP